MANLLLVLLAGVIILKAARQIPEGFAFAVAGDEDMKIVSDGFPTAPVGGDSGDAEAEAKAYMRQKKNGNVDKARALGRQLSDALCGCARELLQPQTQDPALLLRLHHKLLLFSYAVNRVIADFSPNSILAQTTLNVFYNELESSEPELAEHIRDMAAFSLYILCERSKNGNGEDIGKVYARLCGCENQRPIAEEGNMLYRGYYDICSRLYGQTQYKQV